MSATPVANPDPITVRGTILHAQAVDTERNLWTVRLVLPPGAEFPYWTRPGPTVLQVETGKVALTAVTGRVELTFGIDPVIREEHRKGAEYLLAPGDTASFGQGVQQSIRNPVTMPTVIIVTMISPRTETPFKGLVTSQGWRVVIE
jgi:hypothetical protein